MSLALYRKWRPARFEQVVGQEHITRTLQNSVAAGRVGHAYLFCGPRGTGKTTTARLLAKAVNCLHEDLAQRPCNECAMCLAVNEGRLLDLIEIDAASNTGVDDIRDLRDKIHFSPSQGRYKIYIIDEVHMLSAAAFNALLKTLEEPPPHAIFVLATTEEHKVPQTIQSRCQQFNFRLLTTAEISGRLQWLADKEGLTIEPGALALIARQGAGSQRDAESLLDQLIVAPGDTITLERAQMVLGTATDAAVVALAEAWLNADGAGGLRVIHDALASGADARQFCRQMVNHLRTLLLLQAAGPELAIDVPPEHKQNMLQQAERASRQALIAAVRTFHEAAQNPTASWQPQLPLELSFLELLPPTPAPAARLEESAAPTQASRLEGSARATTREDTAQRLEPAPSAPPAAAMREVAAAQAGADDKGAEAARSQTAEVPRSASTDQETPPTLTLPLVQANWPAMMSRIGAQFKNLPPLLAMSKPLAVEGQVIILGFDYPIFKKKFDDTENAAATLADIFSELTNARCLIRPVVTSDYAMPINREAFEMLAQELGGVVHEE